MWLRNKINYLSRIKGHIDTVKQNGAHQLRYAKKRFQNIDLRNVLPGKSTSLHRKYKKLAKILDTDNKENSRNILTHPTIL